MDPDCGSGSWFGEGCYGSGSNGGGTDPISIYTPPTTVYGDAPPLIDTFPVFFQQGGGTTFYAQATASGGGGGATFSVTKTSVADIATKDTLTNSQISSWLKNIQNYVNSHPVTLAVNEIVAGQITYQRSTKTICGSVGLGVSSAHQGTN
jgi:hypothetical protein